MNINKYIDKKYEKLSLKELIKAPVDAIQGISEGDAKLLKEAFNVKTISDLAKLKYMKWAHAICLLADGEDSKPGSYMNINKFLDKKYEEMSFNELKFAPFDALAGVSGNDAKLMREAFRRKELSKYAARAQAIVTLAEGEE
ncbi:MAG: hypothetical protein FWB83_05905 [Treponema sp.]|nr:hypothetical protein [Treponema sp.]